MRKPGRESGLLFPEMEEDAKAPPIPARQEKPATKSEAPRIDEQIHCEYCQDSGVCTYCDRGREELRRSGIKLKSKSRRL